MRPTCDNISKTIATTLITNYLPQMQSDMEKKQMGLAALLMIIVSEEFDRAAANLIEENRELRQLFSEALTVVTNDSLKNRLKEVAESEETDFRVSALDKANSDILSLLIELHSHIEVLEGMDARKIEEAIWQALENYKKRREFMTWDLAATVMASAG